MSQFLEPTFADAVETICRQAVEISHLQKDNARLNARLALIQGDQARGRHRQDDTANISSSNYIMGAQTLADSKSTGVSAEQQLENLSRRYAELQAKFVRLGSEHDECSDRIQAYQQKYREAKARVKEWKEYLEQSGKHSKMYRRLKEDKLLSMTPPKMNHLPKHAGENCTGDDETPKARDPAKTVASSACIVHPEMAAAGTLVVHSSPLQSSDRSGMPRITSSQTTVDEFDDLYAQESRIHINPSREDDPVFVSARPVKRKAGASRLAEPPPQRIKQEPTSPEAVIELNSDEYLGTPQARARRPIRAEPSDLDVVGPSVVTPCQQRHKTHVYQRPRHASCEPARSAPKLTTTASALSESDADLGLSAPNLTSQERQINLRLSQEPLVTHASQHEPRTNGHQSSDVLQPLSINVPTSIRSTDQLQKTKIGSRRSAVRAIIPLLSEGGDDENSQTQGFTSQKREDSNERTAVAKSDHRLNDLLNGQIHERSPVLALKAVESAVVARRSRNSPQFPTPVSGTERKSPAQYKKPFKRVSLPQPREPPPPVLPEHEPLRLRDPKTLRLEDFKVNPNYMGSDFAFADTLRGRDARRDLQTCTRADCCGGALQKAIAIGGSSLSGKTDAQALEIYLGPNWNDHIGAYGHEKRQDIVIQAHVHCFAHQHGKHRQAFARRNTPPGFWDTDFPTTQETAQHREKAREMQRQVVQERWREAILGNGRWRFRDE